MHRLQDPKAEKCGDVVEMWLGLLDIVNMTKGHIKMLNSTAQPIQVNFWPGLRLRSTCSKEFQDPLQHGTPSATRPATRTPPTMRTPQWNRYCGIVGIHKGWACPQTASWPDSLRSTWTPGSTRMTQWGEAEKVNRLAFWSTRDPPLPVPELRTSKTARRRPCETTSLQVHLQKSMRKMRSLQRERKEVINAIGAFFRTAGENNVCIKSGQSGHVEYECSSKGADIPEHAPRQSHEEEGRRSTARGGEAKTGDRKTRGEHVLNTSHVDQDRKSSPWGHELLWSPSG